ncbi:MAG: aminopeptidase family protein [Actinomycetia bacterium]|nr:aminopeptidase family protein [Actinomycetes bacterium]
MVNLGTMALDEGGRIDFDRLRSDRRARVFAMMAEQGLDALILSRESNVRYATGAHRLWVAGTRPFGPGCVLVGETGAVHLMSTWDEGIPAEIPREHLFGMSWNPLILVERLQAIDGLASARRVGVDAMGPLWTQLLPLAAPEAAFVDGEGALRAVRMRKSADEVVCIRTAVAIAEASLSTAIDTIRPGVRERELAGAFAQRMTEFGLTAPAMQGVFCATDPDVGGRSSRLRRIPGDRAVDEGTLVAIAGGVLYAGYEGSVGRTQPCTGRGSRTVTHQQRELFERWSAVWTRIADVLHPGATGADLRAAYEASGEPLPGFPIALSVGVGVEAPIAGSKLGPEFDRQWTLGPGTVLEVQAYVAGVAGGYLGLETVLITDDGHEVLSTLTHGPLAS